MTIETFDQLREFLAAWPHVQHTRSADHVIQRIIDVTWMQAIARDQDFRTDIAALLHQALRRESSANGYEAAIRVPRPLLGEYQHAGLIRHPDAAETELVSSRAWSPTWLEGKTTTPAEIANAEVARRKLRPVDADPFSVRVTGPQNLTVSQRQAMRVVALSPPGSTTVVNLPTGWGKTSVALAPALAESADPGTTVVVVPTVALALDQERRVRRLADRIALSNITNQFTYHGTLDSESRESIRQNIRDGTQRLVFASPESAVGGLSLALKDAASEGRLRYIVIDEAHMVSEWGGGFRPEFQSLAGLRTALVDRALKGGHEAPRTLLLSATFTQNTMDLLETLFGRSQRVVVTGSNVLRPEPEYWVHHCESATEKELRLLEAISMVPKPLIVYTTTREDASLIHQLILASGFRRVAKFTGATNASSREEILSGWRPSDRQPAIRYDIVVATSAFGLGVDLPNVRSVIHACVPESVDRFYQEVGRSGRDGRASLSLVIYDDEDVRVAHRISSEIEKTIGPDKAWRRWQAMQAWRGSQSIGETRLRLSLRARRPDIPGPSEKNEQHNRIVLSIMALAKMIELDDSDERHSTGQGIPQDVEEPWTFQGVRIVKGDMSDETTWKSRFQSARTQVITARRDSWERMKQVLDLDVELAELLADSYKVRDPSTGITRYPEISCGGCSYGRRTGRPPFAGDDPGCPGPSQDRNSITTALQDAFGERDLIVAHYPWTSSAAAFEDILRRLLRALSRHGLRSFVIGRALRRVTEDSLRSTREPYFLSYLEELGATGALLRPRMPELVVLHEAEPVVVRDALRHWPEGRIVLVSDNYPDPSKPNVTVAELRRPSISVGTLIAHL